MTRKASPAAATTPASTRATACATRRATRIAASHRLKVHHHFVNGKVLFEDFVATYEDFETIVAELPDEAHLWPEGKSRRGMSFLSRMGSSRIAVQPNNAMARNGKSAAARRAEKHGIVRN